MGGTAGLPPVAITAVANFRVFPFTSMVSFDTNFPRPCHARRRYRPTGVSNKLQSRKQGMLARCRRILRGAAAGASPNVVWLP